MKRVFQGFGMTSAELYASGMGVRTQGPVQVQVVDPQSGQTVTVIQPYETYTDPNTGDNLVVESPIYFKYDDGSTAVASQVVDEKVSFGNETQVLDSSPVLYPNMSYSSDPTIAPTNPSIFAPEEILYFSTESTDVEDTQDIDLSTERTSLADSQGTAPVTEHFETLSSATQPVVEPMSTKKKLLIGGAVAALGFLMLRD